MRQSPLSSPLSPSRISAFRRRLLLWYHDHARILPWRQTRDPYAIWVSEILLQQTRVETVIPYYERFLKAFPTVAALAAAPFQKVLKVWEGLGYYRRAHLLHKGAQYILSERAGHFPSTVEEWLNVPGVGRYTAGAIVSIAFNKPAPLVDGNVARVLARIIALPHEIDGKGKAILWNLAEALVAPRRAGDFNQALMELGATVCLPRSPRCEGCPVASFCAAYQGGHPEAFPRKKKTRPIPYKEVVAAALWQKDRLLLCRRAAGGMLAGMWELPGGSVRPREEDVAALVRIVREEVGLSITVGEPLATIEHTYSHFMMTLRVYDCRLPEGEETSISQIRLAPHAYDKAAWVRVDEFSHYPLPAADRKAMALILPPSLRPRALSSSLSRRPQKGSKR